MPKVRATATHRHTVKSSKVHIYRLQNYKKMLAGRKNKTAFLHKTEHIPHESAHFFSSNVCQATVRKQQGKSLV